MSAGGLLRNAILYTPNDPQRVHDRVQGQKHRPLETQQKPTPTSRPGPLHRTLQRLAEHQ